MTTKKKVVSVLLAFAVIFGMLLSAAPQISAATPAAVASGWSGMTQWTLTEDGTMRVYGSGSMKNYTSKTAMPWYAYADQITQLVVEDGVTAIGNYAFYGMPALESAQIAETVTAIGDYAFKNCSELVSANLPTGLSSLGDSAFYACSSLEAVEIPASLYTIKPYAFKNCTSLIDVTFHEGNLMKISDGAFYGCSRLTMVEFPACLDIIDVYSFKGCSRLKSITIPAGDLTQIREAVFYGTAIPSITIPEGVTSIKPYAFKNCTKLTGVSLPSTLTSVGFYACTALKTVELPDAVTTIGNYAFRKCAALESVRFSESLQNIGESSFYGCESLAALNIPDSVTTIQGYAFKACTGLTSAALGTGLKTLGESAFHTCTALPEIVIPGNVTSVGAYCFSGSTALASITFEGSAPAIGSGAFNKIVATAYYPADDATWIASVRQNYGGTITWSVVEDEPEVSYTEPTIYVENVTAAAGETVQVPVMIAKNPGVAGATLKLAFDEELTITAAAKGDAFAVLQYTEPYSLANGCVFNWDSMVEESELDGTILVLSFRVPADAAAGEQFGVALSYNHGDIYDVDLNDVTLTMVAGTITVK